MKRKIVQQGKATLMVSLPTKWCQTHQLQKGGEVDIQINEHTLTINSAIPTAQKRETTITISGLIESAIRTIITNTYRTGYDRIKITTPTEQQYQVIYEVIKNQLVGFDITKKEKDYIIIENITEPSADHFETLLAKVFYNIIELITLTIQRLEGKEIFEKYEEIESRIKQYDNFCRRVINKQQLDRERSPLLWTFLTLLIHGQRELYLANHYLDRTKIKASKETIDLIKKIKQVFERIVNAYNRNDIQLLEEINDEEKKIIYRDSYRLLEKKNGKEIVVIYHIAASARNFYLASSPLIGLILGNEKE